MEINNNKQQLQKQQLQEMIALRLGSRGSHVVGSAVNEENAYRDLNLKLDSGHPTGKYAPSGLTGRLRPLLARRDDQVASSESGSNGSPISRLVQAIGTSSSSFSKQGKSYHLAASAPDKDTELKGNLGFSKPVQHGERDYGAPEARPVVHKVIRPDDNANHDSGLVIPETAGHARACTNQQLRLSNRQTDQAILRKEEFQEQLLTDKELELHQLYQSQQQEKDRNQLLKAQVQKDIELHLTKARQELELQRRENAALERDLMKRRDAYQATLQQLLEEQQRKMSKKSFELQSDQDRGETQLDRAGSERNQQRSESISGTQQLTRLLAMHELGALKEYVDSATETSSMSDLGERLVHGERRTKVWQPARLSDSDNESMTRRSRNFIECQRDKQQHHQESPLNSMRPRNDWRAHEIGDAFENQSSLAQMRETASVSQNIRMEENCAGLENETDGVSTQKVGRPLRSRTDSERLNYQRDTGDDRRQLQRQRDRYYSSFNEEEEAEVSDRTQKKLFHHGLGSVAKTYARQQRVSDQLRNFRPRSCERIDSRSRYSSTLLMSSSSGAPPGLRFDQLRTSQGTELDASDYPVRNVMEMDASFTSSEEDSDDDEETIARKNRLKVRQKNAIKENLSSTPLVDDTNAEGPKSADRRSSRRSSIIDDTKVGKIPMESIDKAYVAPDSQRRQSETQSETLTRVPKSIGKEGANIEVDQSQPRRQLEKQPESEAPMYSSSLEESDSEKRNQRKPDPGKTGTDSRGASRRLSTSKGVADALPEEWSGLPPASQYPSRSDETTEEIVANRRGGEDKMKRLRQRTFHPDSDEDDDEDLRRVRRKQRRGSKQSIISSRSMNQADGSRSSIGPTRKDVIDDQHPADSSRGHSEKSIQPAASDAAAVNGGKNADSRFQDASKPAKPDAYSDSNQRATEKVRKNAEPLQKQHGRPAALQSSSKTDAELRVSPALPERSLNTSMKLGITGEQEGLQQHNQEEPQPPGAGRRNSWRSKHNKTAIDSYTQDSEHRGALEDTRDTDSDSRSAIPNQGSYALRTDSGSKVQLLARKFLQHKDKQAQQMEATTPESESTRKEASKQMPRQENEASKLGAAATTKVKDEKPAASLFEKKALANSVSRLPAMEGAPMQVNPDDALSEEDIEACKTRAQRKNEERRKRRQNKDDPEVAPASDDEDSDVAPVMQEGIDEQQRRSRKEPDDSDVAPVTRNTQRGDENGVMALERKRAQEQQAVKPRVPKPKEEEVVAARAPLAPARPHRRRKRRSSRIELLGRSVSMPPQPTVIYCCPPPCPPVNSCSMRCAVPSCYPTANYCSVACRRC